MASETTCSNNVLLDTGQKVSKHIPQLDGLRGLAILGVLFCHFFIVEEQGPSMWNLSTFSGPLGATGVDLFFVLSGFLITGILFDAKGSVHYFRNFYMRRTLRIFPLYYGILFVIFVLIPAFRSYRSPAMQQVAHEQAYLWTYLTNYIAFRYDSHLGNFSHFWSLAVEEQFYLFWPIIILIFSRKAALRICAACILVSWTCGVVIACSNQPILMLRVITPCRLDVLAIGSAVALCSRGPHQLLRLQRYAGPIASICLPLLLLIVVLMLEATLAPRILEALPMRIVLTFGYAALLILALTTPAEHRLCQFLSQPLLMSFGKYSYGLYVFHFLLIGAWERLFKPKYFEHLFHSAYAAALAYFILASAASFAVAWVSWHLYEKHFLKLKRFFPNAASR